MRVLSSIVIGSRAFATSILAAIVLFTGCGGAGGETGPAASNQLVLISIDGFRYDYQDLYDTPALDRIAATGVRASSLRPVFPTLTFPNHYSIATGLYPAEHGIVHNHFQNDRRDAWYHIWDRSSVEDGSWYGGEPIWVAAERHGMVSAAYYFVGTEAPVGGIQPTHWYPFDASVTAGARVDQVIDWLRLPAGERPRVITLYFEDVDDAGHDHGQGTPELEQAITLVDTQIGRLLDAIEHLGMTESTAIFVVSDHGQVNHEHLDSALVLDEIIELEGLSIHQGGAYAWIYQDVPDRDAAITIRDTINAQWANGKAILREDAPAEWRVTGRPRFPEIFVQPDLHHAVVTRRDRIQGIKPGDHGWAPEHLEMHGIFLMTGAGVPDERALDDVSVVDIYPLMLDVLGIRDSVLGSEPRDAHRIAGSDE